MKYGRFVYYQPNDLDVKDQAGDCQIRALCKVLGLKWREAFDLTIPICRELQTYTIFGGDLKKTKAAMEQLGFSYTGISNKKGSKRPTVDSFAKDHQNGSYIVSVANHVVAVVDGKYYDIWDSGYKSLYGYYEKTGDLQDTRIIADRLAEYENHGLTQDDAISRQATIEALTKASQKAWDTLAVDDCLIIQQSDALEVIRQLPSAQPERKKRTPLLEKREWIEGYENRWYRKNFYCASCGIKIKTESWDEKRCFGEGTILQDNNMPNFCPNCGVKMDGGEYEKTGDLQKQEVKKHPERLTKWNGKKWILPQGRNHNGESYWRIIADTLAEYENNGLTQDEIENLKRM